jgi:predicted TIM-barrel fold metal-dependent hydrolase
VVHSRGERKRSVLHAFYATAPNLVRITAITAIAAIASFCGLLSPLATAQTEPLDGREGRNLLLENFRPQPMLSVPQTSLTKAKFPAIDVHTHFRYKLKPSAELLDEFVQVMDRNNIAICVSLDGRLGDELTEHAKFLWTKYPNRFAIFANIPWQGTGKADDPVTWDCQRPDFGRRMARELAVAKQAGACGLKVFKQFGLGYKNPDGSLIKIDDPRWDEIWQACGELGLPVIMHVADPAAFFQPIDEHNERWEELHRHPDWSFFGPQFPQREELFAAFNHIVARHPKTTFIAAHLANNPENLAIVSAWLDKYPNLVVEIASRINELGRQPVTARKFFLKYSDRILFGTDGPWPEQRLHYYWRFLETSDENFPYSEKIPPPQGLWNIFGIDLPDDVLRKVYHDNALRIMPTLREKFERYKQKQAK